ncbi:Josephin-domain-containing protein [Macrolepiota fuliginosa MF-IS2]|uniref:ubiquitinyl hydrolase 1 n=1 Tax=Macrolepiota fuliginosa MF-IS2 TaxID=1400762 RepID=A0A9P5XAJ7_9AGAR|nr:Josephin-domain-containing protein [Macrolepiota fuliginosa MF-IS2]
MAGLEGLVSIIYHEKQQSGSMLCAQHALNSLLQGPFFTAPDLSEIARNLDLLEAQYNTESERGESKNMDDTGFFSVQVVEEALKVWGLNLVRWRSTAMRPFQDHPHTQLAFILNFQQHWFTLRRFGPASADIGADSGEGHWFNLNSFLPAPEWVGRLYLSMVLGQAETEGYSVFAITQADPSIPLALARTDADDVAASLPEPMSASQSSVYNATKRNPDVSRHPVKASGSKNPLHSAEGVEGAMEGVEDEDYDLQAALQASLASQEGYGSHHYGSLSSSIPADPPSLVRATSSSTTYATATSRSTSTNSSTQSSQPLGLPGHADLDPVTASMERNRVLLQRMREQQEFAQRELWSGNGLTPEEEAIQEARRQAQRRQEEEEEEQLRKAIAESEAMAREWDGQQRKSDPDEPPSIDRGVGELVSSGHLVEGHRNYDDEDQELQAALSASLQNIPSEWQPSDLPLSSAPKQSQPNRSAPPKAKSSEVMDKSNKSDSHNNMDVDDDEEWHSESEASDPDVDIPGKQGASAPEGQSSPPTLDEIRKARLARFGL